MGYDDVIRGAFGQAPNLHVAKYIINLEYRTDTIAEVTKRL